MSNNKVINYDNVNDTFAVDIGEEVLQFIRDDDLYKCFQVNAIFQDSLSKNQLNKINIIKDLYNKLAFPSDQVIENIIKNKSINGLEVDIEDFKRYKKMYPKRVEIIRGKSTRISNAYIPMDDDTRAKMFNDRTVDLAVDIFYLHGYKFIIAVNTVFDLTNVRVIKNRSKAEINEALCEFINIYSAYNWRIRKIYCDNEKGVVANEKDMLEKGILIEYVSPNTHVSVAERKVRTIKERCRTILNSIKYKLPSRE